MVCVGRVVRPGLVPEEDEDMKAHEMTFGVEIECYVNPGCTPVGGYHSPIQVPWLPQGWAASRDGSLGSPPPGSGKMGVEFVSPILQGKAGFDQVVEVIAKIKQHGGEVNASCGYHVHVGFNKRNYGVLAHLIGMVANHEKAIYAATGGKSRERGVYAKPIKGYGNGEAARRRAERDRMHVLNLATGSKPTVEVRAFPGTLNPVKACGYIGIALGITEKSYDRHRENARIANWNQRTAATPSTEGQVEMERLLKALGWVGRNPKAVGFLRGGSEAEKKELLKKTVKELRRLAVQYDGSN